MANRSQARRFSLGEREEYGANLIPIRTAEGGGLEVLLGQNPVVDWVKNSAAGTGVSFRSYPGEFRFLGSRAALDEDSTPLDTAVRDLTPAGWPEMLSTILTIMSSRPEGATLRGAVQPALFAVCPKLNNRGIRVYQFICAMDGLSNDDSLSGALNEQMRNQLDACEAYGDDFFNLSHEVRAAQSPKLRQLEWRRVHEVMVEAAADKDFVNDWQRDMFRRHHIGGRQVACGTLRALEKLSVYRSAEEVFQEARRYEQEVRNLPGDVLANKAPDLAVCLPDHEELVLLSYNLNALPWGAQVFGSGQGIAAAKRLAIFLQRLGDKPPVDRPDLIVVQELFSTPFIPLCCRQHLFIKRMVRFGYRAVTAGHPTIRNLLLDRKWTDSGLVIFSRLPVVSTGELVFRAGTGLDAGAMKGAVWARVRLAAGKFLDVFNCHLQATHTGSGKYEAVRREQLQSLREFISERAVGQPFVLMGDFNVDAIAEPNDPRGAFGYALRPSSCESSDYKAMLQILDPYDELTDVLLLSQDGQGLLRGHPCTRPPRQHLPKTARAMIKHKHPQRLDYIFFRPTISSLVEHVHSEVDAFEVTGHRDLKYLSDHWGIRSRFRIKCGFAWKHSRVEACKVESDWNAASRDNGLLRVVALAIPLLGAAALWPWLGMLRPLSLLCVIIIAFISVSLDSKIPARHTGSIKWSGGGTKDTPGTASLSQANNPYDAFLQSVLRHCSRRCVGVRSFNTDGTRGPYEWMTYEQVHRRVLLLASGLRHEFGLHANSKVGLLGDVCLEWVLSELALMQLGVQTICLLNINEVGQHHDGNGANAADLILCSCAWVEHVLDRGLELGIPIVTFEPLSARLRARARMKTWQLVDIPYCVEVADVRGLVSQGYAAAWATFTSMTVWNTFGSRTDGRNPQSWVFISMQQLAQKAATMASELRLGPDDVHFSYQAPAWIGERVLLHATLAAGGAIGFFQGVRSPKLFEDIKALHPTFLTGTPKVFFEQLRQLQEEQAFQLGLLGRACFAVQAALLDSGKLPLPVLDFVVGRFRRQVLGNLELRFVLILCTPTLTATQHGFCRWLRTLLLCPVLKSLVVTQAAGFVTLGEAPYRGGTVKSFAVGKPLPYVQLTVTTVPDLGISCADLLCDELGQMVITGPSVGGGGCDEVLPVRQVHSGASVDVLIGRRGDSFFVFGSLSSVATMPGGRYLLEALEQLCTQHAGWWLSQLYLTVRKGGLVGVAAVQVEHLWREALRHNLCQGASMGDEDLCMHHSVRNWCLGDLQRSCHGLDLGLRLQSLHLVAEAFCYENGLQTPTFQLLRDKLQQKYADVIAAMTD